MKTIKSKKSKNKYDDFEDLFCDIKKLDNEICKNNKKKKKKKHKNKSSKKSSKNNIKISDNYFGINNKQRRNLNKSGVVKKKDIHRGILDRLADLFNIDTNIDIRISDDAVNSVMSCLVGIIATIFLKKNN